MLISEFAEKAGIGIDTLRYYDNIGLLVPARKNGNRCYTEEDLKKAKEIDYLKSLRFTLDEIQVIFVLDDKMEKWLDKGLSESEIVKKEKDTFQSMKDMLKKKQQEIIEEEQKIKKAKTLLAEIQEKLASFEREE